MRKGIFTLLFTIISTLAMGQGMVEGYNDFIGPAKAGDARAQFYIGLFYEQGRDVPKDEKQAISWYLKAAKQGFVRAQEKLAGRYFRGQGLEKDYKQAVYWWRKAVEGDDEAEQSLFMLAKCYENGLGVQVDILQAIIYYQRAIDSEGLDETDEEIAKQRIEFLKRMSNDSKETKPQKAQELTVQSMKADPSDLTASTYERKDLAGKACAVVKVPLAVPGVQFEGNVLPPTEFKTSEYWVYLSEGTKEMRIKCPGFVSQHVNFGDYGIKSVKSKVTYSLTLSTPSTQLFTIRYSPADAIVLIDSKPYNGKNGVVTATLSLGSHDYVVTAEGYDPYDGSVKLKESAPSTVTVNLERTNAKAK